MSPHIFDTHGNSSAPRSSDVSQDMLAKRAQVIGTLTSYSVYQLSEANTHRQYIECESEGSDGLILVDPDGTDSR